MFLTLQRLIAQSNKFFLRETGQDSDNLKTTLENQPTENLETDSDQGEAMQTLQQQLELAKLEQTIKLPFLVRKSIGNGINQKEKSIETTNNTAQQSSCGCTTRSEIDSDTYDDDWQND